MKDAVAALKKALKKKVVDPFEVGDVIKWTSGGRWTYVALKTEGGWFTTARTGNPFVDSRFDLYEELVEVLHQSDVTDIMVVSGWEPVQ